MLLNTIRRVIADPQLIDLVRLILESHAENEVREHFRPQQCLVSGTTPTLPVRPNVCLRAAVGRTKPDAATAARRVVAMTASRPRLPADCGGGSFAALSRTSRERACAYGFCGGALEKLVHPGAQVRKACARLPERDSHLKPLLVRRVSPRHLCAGGQGLDRHRQIDRTGRGLVAGIVARRR